MFIGPYRRRWLWLWFDHYKNVNGRIVLYYYTCLIGSIKEFLTYLGYFFKKKLLKYVGNENNV